MGRILTEQEKTESNEKSKELFENYNPQYYKTKEEKFKACQAISLDEFQEMGIRRIKELTDVMVYLKEDGSLDIDKINNLPEKEYMDEISNLSEEQFNEYLYSLPINESLIPFQPNRVNCSMEEYVEKYHLVNADELINKII